MDINYGNKFIIHVITTYGDEYKHGSHAKGQGEALLNFRQDLMVPFQSDKIREVLVHSELRVPV